MVNVKHWFVHKSNNLKMKCIRSDIHRSNFSTAEQQKYVYRAACVCIAQYCLRYLNIQSPNHQYEVKYHSSHNFHYLWPIYPSNINTRQTLTWQEIGVFGSRRRLSNFAKILRQRLSKWLMQVIGPPRVQEGVKYKRFGHVRGHDICSSYISITNLQWNSNKF